MKNNYYFSHLDFNIDYGAFYSWMSCVPGNDELGSDNQGRSTRSSFSQETGGINKVQYWSRIDQEQTLLVSAGCTMVSDSSSLFSFNSKNTKRDLKFPTQVVAYGTI